MIATPDRSIIVPGAGRDLRDRGHGVICPRCGRRRLINRSRFLPRWGRRQQILNAAGRMIGDDGKKKLGVDGHQIMSTPGAICCCQPAPPEPCDLCAFRTTPGAVRISFSGMNRTHFDGDNFARPLLTCTYRCWIQDVDRRCSDFVWHEHAGDAGNDSRWEMNETLGSYILRQVPGEPCHYFGYFFNVGGVQAQSVGNATTWAVPYPPDFYPNEHPVYSGGADLIIDAFISHGTNPILGYDTLNMEVFASYIIILPDFNPSAQQVFHGGGFSDRRTGESCIGASFSGDNSDMDPSNHNFNWGGSFSAVTTDDNLGPLTPRRTWDPAGSPASISFSFEHGPDLVLPAGDWSIGYDDVSSDEEPYGSLGIETTDAGWPIFAKLCVRYGPPAGDLSVQDSNGYVLLLDPLLYFPATRNDWTQIYDGMYFGGGSKNKITSFSGFVGP
jgi:hypothetical protein